MDSDGFGRGQHRQLHLLNFTVFGDVELRFIPGVNVFVGENGSGKTHLLKILYAFELARWLWVTDRLGPEVVSMVDPPEGGVFEIVRQVFGASSAGELNRVDARGNVELWRVGAASDTTYWNVQGDLPRPVFIPALDMLGHTKGFATLYDEYAIDFDRTYRDIVGLLLGPTKRELDGPASELASELSRLLNADLELEGDRFYLRSAEGRFAAPVLAEGLRKVATLLRLVQTGWLVPGATLYWDEPEVNLNPVLLDNVVEAILTLARRGIQVFLATHSYIVLEELRDRAKPGEVRYFGLKKDGDGVHVHETDDLPSLRPNPILDQYEDLANRKLRRAFATADRA